MELSKNNQWLIRFRKVVLNEVIMDCFILKSHAETPFNTVDDLLRFAAASIQSHFN